MTLIAAVFGPPIDLRSTSPRRRLAQLVVAGLLVAGFGCVAWWSRASARRERSATAQATPFRNARPGVKYVGDQACVRCHSEIAASYGAHPMGRSLAPIGSASSPGGDGVKFEVQGLEYAIERRGGRVVHKETRRDAKGRVVAGIEAEVRYALGSGTRGISYLVDRDGYLFQSPISWYSQERKWDLAPGYRAENQHFERAIGTDCLFCHANRVEPVAGTVDRYREPIFRGHAIGCERCHGPGELHAKRQASPGERDDSIVNPGRLEPALREAVCQQCHLQGEARIARAGREVWDYRPGLPLDEFLVVFFRRGGPSRENRAVGHVEQLHASRCFRASGGKLGCTSCHDPHQAPAAEDKAAYYRARCLDCHGEPRKGCSLPVAERRAQSADDSCIQCHMPRAAIADIAHTAATLHQIPRRAEAAEPKAEDAGSTPAGPPRLVAFPGEEGSATPRAGFDRDRGVALGTKAREVPDRPVAAGLGSMALPLLESALKDRPDDVPAWEAKAAALFAQGRGEEAMKAMEQALALAPGREQLLAVAAPLAARIGRRSAALDYARRALDLDPWRSDTQLLRAQVYLQDQDWRRAAEACREALRINPMHLGARRYLVLCHVCLGETRQARAELETLLGFDPPDREALLRSVGEGR
jgi:predicted CXXCH cytochrome family protein